MAVLKSERVRWMFAYAILVSAFMTLLAHSGHLEDDQTGRWQAAAFLAGALGFFVMWYTTSSLWNKGVGSVLAVLLVPVLWNWYFESIILDTPVSPVYPIALFTVLPAVLRLLYDTFGWFKKTAQNL